MKKIAFLADPLDSFKIEKDSTYAMMLEAEARGHEIYAFEPRQVTLDAGTVCATCSLIALNEEGAEPWYTREETGSGCFPLSYFDAVIVRKDPPFDMAYLYTTYLLELAEKQGCRVFNRAGALRDFNEKLAIARFPEFIVRTLVTAEVAQLRQFHAEHGDVIYKPLDGMGGQGIFRIGQDGMNLGSAIETLTQNGEIPIMAQQYIPEIEAGDKRILLIDGEVVPYALARIPQEGETRGNLAAGATGKAQPLTARDREIAETLAPQLASQGLFLVGLDIIGDWLTEVNVTSPTCFREITAQTGFNVAGCFMDCLERRI